jgi:hypothetical protein
MLIEHDFHGVLWLKILYKVVSFQNNILYVYEYLVLLFRQTQTQAHVHTWRHTQHNIHTHTQITTAAVVEGLNLLAVAT